MREKKVCRKMLLAVLLGAALTILFSITAFAAPGGLKQTRGSSSSISFTWNSTYATKYDIAWSTNKSSWNYDYSYGVDGYIGRLNAGRTYYVKVREENSSQWSSTVAMVTSPDYTGSRQIYQTNATTSSVSIKWQKTSGANRYLIETKLGNQNYVKKGVVKSNTATLKGLKSGQEYYVRITPYRTSGSFNAMGYSFSTSDIKTVTGKVTGLKASEGSTSKLYFTWNRKTTVKGYQIELIALKNNKKKYVNVQGSYPYQTVTVSEKTFYKARIRSYILMSNNAKKYSAWSGYTYVCAQSSRLSGRQSGTSYTLSWSKVAGATGYQVYISNNYRTGYRKLATTRSTSYKIRGLSRGNGYYIKLVPVKKVGGKVYRSTTNRYTNIYMSKYR